MAKRKESKEISRKIRQQEKEKKRQIDLANRMLVPSPKKTTKSIGLLSFDPTGAFHFEGGRWVKVYEVTGNLSEIAEATTKMQSRVRIVLMIVPEKDGDAYVKTYVSLIGYGDIYEDVRLAFEADERIMQDTVGLRSLIVDEAISVITKLNGINKEPFSYASFVRSRTDLSKKIFPDVTAKRDGFSVNGQWGESFFVMEYPSVVTNQVFMHLKELGCPVYMSFDLYSVSVLDQENYNRTLERKYCRSFSKDSYKPFMNVSCAVTILCDSTDAREIIKETVTTLFNRASYVIAPCFGAQREAYLSATSLGLVDYRNFKNVPLDTVKEIARREYVGNKDEV